MRTTATPLGPDSLTWRYFGDWRGLLQGLWAGGGDSQGRSYHALDPDTFYWAHATFFMGTILAADRFMGGIDEDGKRRLFDEHKTWYAMYGMSMRPVPNTWEDFQTYWKHMCTDVLEVNKATRDVLDLADLPKPPTWWMPAIVWWRLLQPGIARAQVWTTMHLHRLYGRTVNVAFRLIPRRRRPHPRARAGWDRATGRSPVDAPLPETHDRNLPPVVERNDPSHYVPGR